MMSKGGQNCALKLLRKRKKVLKKDETPFKRRYHIADAVVLDFVDVEAKQPNSALRKCVKIELNKLKQKVLAFVPYCGGRTKVKIHDIVTVKCIGGSKCRSRGDLVGPIYEVVKINNISLREKFLNKK